MKLNKNKKFYNKNFKESFSNNLKREIIENILKDIKKFNEEEYVSFILGFNLTRNIFDKENNIYEFSNRNIRKVFIRLLKNINEEIDIVKEKIDILNKKLEKEDSIDEKIYKNILLGAFLSSGYINDPKNQYNFEINIYIKDSEDLILKIMKKLDLNCYIYENEEYKKYYIKKGDDIFKILAFIGASKTAIKFEEERVIKNANQEYNRYMNFEFSNMNKTLSAAKKQIDAIMKIEDKDIKLDEKLKEAAEMRKKYPEMSLKEIAEKTGINKSTLNMRLKKIEEIANKI